ncbi:RYamide receptor-like [Mizuhopecten yessoensis]|uniref:Neuropeptide Y receptor n=1 Tax=Mizuhopecten yessoensis TaxID=6573 RepID=A0A210R670_MIZYE|nr:RYamide receptor-like [Mizuhopecten yessoensis]OWF56520.1 Neuropeptide Y receptor [Mizuhopecten yessoensis]
MNNSVGNGTDYDHVSSPPISDYLQTFFILLYGIIVIIAIGGNTIVCYLIYAYKRMHTIPNYFIVNLAISDIIMAIFCIPFTFVANLMLNYWPFGEVMCPIVTYLQVVAVFLSAFTLVAMSLDRYIVIVHPFKKRITARKTGFVLLGIWTLSLTIPLPTLLQSKLVYYSNTSGVCLEPWEDFTAKYAYSLIIMILHYFGPLVVLVFCYSKIGYNIWMKNIQGDERNKRRLQLASAKQRLIKMMATVVIFYALCWLPLHVVTLVGEQDPTIYNSPHMPVVWVFCHWLAMSNSCYNPIIYIYMSPKFRTGLKLAVQKCARMRKQSMNCDSDDDDTQVKGQHKQMILKMELKPSKSCPLKGRNGNCQLMFEKILSEEYMMPASIHSDT